MVLGCGYSKEPSERDVLLNIQNTCLMAKKKIAILRNLDIRFLELT